MTRAAIMQPTYLPWLGYFALVDRVDVFVFLDDVGFDRRSWQQRNRVKGPNGEIMLTVPVQKAPRGTPIDAVEINREQGFPDKHLATLEHCYRAAPHFERFWPGLAPLLSDPPGRLADLNITIIDWLAGSLGLGTPFVRSSTIDVEGRKAEYLAALCAALDVTSYLSPPGSQSYLDESSAFAERGITVEYLDFQHPEYPQLHGPFISHMSAIDALFNVGAAASALLRGDR